MPPDARATRAQALRREVDKKEAALQVARLTLLEAEKKLKGRAGPADGCAFDASYGWNRRNAGSYVGALPAPRASRSRRVDAL